MLFAVRMDVAIPRVLEPTVREEMVAREKAYSQELQRTGEWVYIWRIVGQYSNISIFDVESNDRLHEIIWALPLFPFMRIEITPLAAHPSSI